MPRDGRPSPAWPGGHQMGVMPSIERSRAMSTTARLFPLDLGQLPSMLFGPPAFRVEEFTDGTTFVVRAEVPGLDAAKDIKVSQVGDRLQIHIERTAELGDRAH